MVFCFSFYVLYGIKSYLKKKTNVVTLKQYFQPLQLPAYAKTKVGLSLENNIAQDTANCVFSHQGDIQSHSNMNLKPGEQWESNFYSERQFTKGGPSLYNHPPVRIF